MSKCSPQCGAECDDGCIIARVSAYSSTAVNKPSPADRIVQLEKEVERLERVCNEYQDMVTWVERHGQRIAKMREGE